MPETIRREEQHRPESPAPPDDAGRLRHIRRFLWRNASRFWDTLSVGGMAMALAFFCLSMTPSLLPREWYLQGVASGICMASAYAIGTTISWGLRRMGFTLLHRKVQQRAARRTLAGAAVVLVPLFGLLGAHWQREVRELAGADLSDPFYYPLVLIIAFALARVVLWLARWVRFFAARLAGILGRWIPRPIAKLVGAVVVLFAVVTLANNTLVPALIHVGNESFSLTDRGTAEGISRPIDSHRSGSDASLVAWDSLGREGRSFVALGPSAAEIETMTGRAAQEPIRVYAGLDSADGLQAQADLVVAELERTGAFDRSVLVVTTSTGRGWINHAGAAVLEYLWGGDTAIAGMQYSYLPSPVAFVADTRTPPHAARILLDTVRTTWLSYPVDHRPALIVLGESLGSFGSQDGFDSLTDVLTEVDGAIWVGTPSSTELWEKLTAKRDTGSPQQHPDINGCHLVCFSTTRGDIPPDAHPRVLYLQHANDPVVWWSYDLLLSEPDWLVEAPLPERSPAMRWLPVVTFWQVTMDIVFSTEMPDGQGHHYGSEYVDAYLAVIPPPHDDPELADRLRALAAEMDTGG